MYAITGITGQVGGAAADSLLAAGQAVRAVLRDQRKGQAWQAKGCALAIAEIDDVAAMTAALREVQGVFVLLPPLFDPSPGFPEVRALIDALLAAIRAANPPKVVLLSTIGAQARQPNLLNQLGLAEQAFATLPMPVTYLRAAWFIENALWDVAAARQEGVLRSFLQPLNKPVPMVATRDIGALVAELLQETWSGQRVVELEGPRRVTPNQLAAAFADALGRPVRAEAVPRESWLELFRAQGMANPLPRLQMLDGFNEGWIAFESDAVRRGPTKLETVIGELIQRG
jgi:NAD(P)H dehydrogenase (quinone)